MKTLSSWLAFVVCLAASLAWAEDWPQWRGVNRDGKSAETGLLDAWPEGGPKLLWHAQDIGEGYSTPAVVGGSIYVISNRGADNEFVQSLDTNDGRQVWSTTIGKVGSNKGPQYPGSRSTPTVVGDLLWALGSDGDLVCLDKASGKINWRKNLRADFAGEPGDWAYSESVLVDGDVVVCTPGGADATLLALDKFSGDVVWKAAIPGGDQAAYASIITVEVGSEKQYVQFLQKGLVGVEAKTGKFLWRYTHTAEGSPANIPTPVATDNYIYSATGRGGGGLVQLRVTPDGVAAEEVYFQAKLPTSIGGSVLNEGYLYGTNTGGLMCVDFAAGNVKWQERGVGAGAVCYADSRLYVHGESGEVALVDPSPNAYQERGRFTPPDQPKHAKAKAWAYPVVANGRLYLRDQGSLWVYDVQKPKAE